MVIELKQPVNQLMFVSNIFAEGIIEMTLICQLTLVLLTINKENYFKFEFVDFLDKLFIPYSSGVPEFFFGGDMDSIMWLGAGQTRTPSITVIPATTSKKV